MKRLPCAVHQRHSDCGRRKLTSAMSSASRSVVELIAPRCTIASSSWPEASSHAASESGWMSSRSGARARLRHLSPWRSRSHTATGWFAAASAATTFEPMKPAPPVTRIMADAHACSELERHVQPHTARAVEGLATVAVLGIARQGALARQFDAGEVVEIQVPVRQQVAPLGAGTEPPAVGRRRLRIAGRAGKSGEREVAAETVAVVDQPRREQRVITHSQGLEAHAEILVLGNRATRAETEVRADAETGVVARLGVENIHQHFVEVRPHID